MRSRSASRKGSSSGSTTWRSSSVTCEASCAAANRGGCRNSWRCRRAMPTVPTPWPLIANVPSGLSNWPAACRTLPSTRPTPALPSLATCNWRMLAEPPNFDGFENMPGHANTLTVVNRAKGGIGNQLFQHVFAASLARRLGGELRTDTNYFGADPYGFAAAVWNLDPHARAASIAEHAGAGSYLLREGSIRALDQLQPLPADARSLVLDGYWQGEAYFDPDVARQTYAQLAARVEPQVDAVLLARLRSSPNAVAVHLRRRDYAHMGLCKDSYYVAAIDHLRLNHADAELFVFSDEPNYTRHLLDSRGIPFTPVSSDSDLGDLFLMSQCRHFIVSNSSYSWWGAWFGEQCGGRGGLVIAPREWVTINATPSPCPARWLQLVDAVRPFALDEVELTGVAARLQRQRFDDALRAWFGARGDQTLRVEFGDLGPGSLVLDLAGYKGDWTAEISRRYGSRVMVFEPIRAFHDQIRDRFAGTPEVQPFQFGLGARDEVLEMHHSADGTGAFVQGQAEQVRLVQASGFLHEHGVQQIDLLKINIEGGEFELLEHLIATGEIARVRRLQVQFHDFVPDALARRARLVQQLGRTHRQNWCFYFVWEEWALQL
ncbi:MAG: FkbM family methyltransferase [Rubrivivax sp.]|nr:MAG: FkbM family methyltransferase [Rubrivivax sp.]